MRTNTGIGASDSQDGKRRHISVGERNVSAGTDSHLGAVASRLDHSRSRMHNLLTPIPAWCRNVSRLWRCVGGHGVPASVPQTAVAFNGVMGMWVLKKEPT
jgi:hypothetical protein